MSSIRKNLKTYVAAEIVEAYGLGKADNDIRLAALLDDDDQFIYPRDVLVSFELFDHGPI